MQRILSIFFTALLTASALAQDDLRAIPQADWDKTKLSADNRVKQGLAALTIVKEQLSKAIQERDAAQGSVTIFSNNNTALREANDKIKAEAKQVEKERDDAEDRAAVFAKQAADLKSDLDLSNSDNRRLRLIGSTVIGVAVLFLMLTKVAQELMPAQWKLFAPFIIAPIAGAAAHFIL